MHIKPESLKELRVQKKLTREQLAGKSRISQRQIARIENDPSSASKVRERTIMELAKALEVEVGVLTGELPLPVPTGSGRLCAKRKAIRLESHGADQCSPSHVRAACRRQFCLAAGESQKNRGRCRAPPQPGFRTPVLSLCGSPCSGWRRGRERIHQIARSFR